MNKKNILIVDDSTFDRDLFKVALARVGEYSVIEAETGAQCLDVLSKEHVDLVLMDIMMPGPLGTEVLTKIREKFSPLDLPIIMVTAKSDASDVVGCLRCGASDYITKPVNYEIAMSRINTHLRLSEYAEEASKLKEAAAINAMIATYNHEINNPLAIAISYLDNQSLRGIPHHAKLEEALWRISDIVKRIAAISVSKTISYDQYSSSSKSIKLR